jgi:hypothetical protein
LSAEDSWITSSRRFVSFLPTAQHISAAQQTTLLGQHLDALALLQKLLQGLNELFLEIIAPDVENDIYEVVV